MTNIDKFLLNNDLAYKKFNKPDIPIEKLFVLIDKQNVWDLKQSKLYLNYLYQYKKEFYNNNNVKYEEKIDIYISYLEHIINDLNDFQNHLLTLVATIFLPLSFITGFFGMNFKSMGAPSLDKGIFTIDNAEFKILLVIFVLIVATSFFFYKVLKI